MRQKISAASAIAASLAFTPAYALDVGFAVTAESEYTTNSGLTERDEVEEWIHSPGATIQAAHDGPNLTLDLNYDFNRRIYQQDLYDDENEAAGSANLVWNALPERLDVIANHTRTQSAIRSINATTPDNRQETINSSVGPRLRFSPRAQDEIQLEYLWGDRSSEESDTDAITHNTTFRYILGLSSTQSLTFSAINNQVQYENRFIPDIEYNIGQVTWDRESGNVSYALTGGYNQTERTNNRDDVDGFIFDAEVNWQARPTTGITFSAARDIRDQSENLQSGSFAEDLDFSVDSDLGEVFTNERIGLSIQQRIDGRTNLTLSATVDSEDYEDVGRDTDRQALNLDITRQWTRRLDLSIGIGLENQDFEDEGDESDTLRGDLSLDYDFGRNIDLGFTIRYEERDSDSNVNTRNYDEWAAIFSFSYAIVPLDQR